MFLLSFGSLRFDSVLPSTGTVLSRLSQPHKLAHHPLGSTDCLVLCCGDLLAARYLNDMLQSRASKVDVPASRVFGT